MNWISAISPEIPATPKAYFLTPPPTIEHPKRRHWHTVDTDMNESDSDESEKEYPDNTDVKETDLVETEREEPDDTDVNESDSGEKDQDEDDNGDHGITRVPWNVLHNSQRVRGLKAYYLRNTRRTQPY